MDIKEFSDKSSRIINMVSMIPRSIYYSHCRAIYNTPQEERDIKTLRSMGFQVVNPSAHVHQAVVNSIEKAGGSSGDVMQYFVDLVVACDNFAFRSLPGGFIPAGVAMELAQAREVEMPIIELPNLTLRQYLSVAETRDYMKECGAR